ncbi:MAG: hypothetical protein HOK61_02890 [Alphaproteobacteria bacterium]|nr:hypothetical protein [Alphaproteobacteria bacterium]
MSVDDFDPIFDPVFLAAGFALVSTGFAGASGATGVAARHDLAAVMAGPFDEVA